MACALRTAGLAILLSTLLASGATVLGQSPAITVEGFVVEQGTNNVLSKATLDLRALDNPNARYPALTSGEGKFLFRNVLPGRYSLVAMRAGYVRAEYGQRGPNGTPIVLEVRAGQNVRDIRISMIPTAALSGRVVDIKGEPLLNAQLHGLRVSYADGWRKLMPIMSTMTNDLGEYRLFGLPPGQYYVSAQPEPQGFIRSPAYASLAPPLPGMVITTNTAGGSGGVADPANNSFFGANYAPIYFGGGTDEFSATPITLRAGNDLKNVDIVVERIPMGAVSGTVLDSATRQPVGANVTVTPLASNVSFTSLTDITVTGGVLNVTAARPIGVGVQGQFRTASLPNGAYLVTAVADLPTGRLAGQAIADTRNPDPAGVRIAVAPSFQISGQIVFDGMAPLQNLKVGLMSTANQSLNVPAVPVSTTGGFTLQGVTPGHYLVQVTLGNTPNAYVKSARLANVDVLSYGLRLDNATDGRLEIVIAGNPAKVSGAVSSVDRQPLAGITTVLLPDDRQRIDLYRSAVTDASGQYRFDAVSPGRYRLFAWEDVEKNAWRDAGFMTTHEDRGSAIVVDAGGNHTVSLTAIPPR